MRKTDKVLNSINSREISVLESIYKYRCLTDEQIYKLHYKYSQRTGDVVSDSYSKVKIKELLKLQAIQEEEYINDKYYFLTNLGIKVLRTVNSLPTVVFDMKRNKIKQGYHTSAELKISPKLLIHQKNLINFMIDFSNNHETLNYSYFDEKDVTHYRGIRPDGLISINNTDVFLEMDMSTESKKQLVDKWMNYRDFLNSPEFQLKNKKIIMLFIIEGKHQYEEKREREEILKRIYQRTKIVKKTIADNLFDVIDENFDIYVGSKDKMLHLLKNKLVPLATNNSYQREEVIKNVLATPKKLDFSISYFDKLFKNNKKMPYNEHPYKFRFYIFHQKYDTTNGIQVKADKNGKKLEFFLDDYYYSSISTALKASMFQVSDIYYKEKINREIRYVLVGKNEKEIYEDMKLYDLMNVDNLYFTTLKRLNTLGFPEALFTITATGNLYRYLDNELEKIEMEKNLRYTQ